MYFLPLFLFCVFIKKNFLSHNNTILCHNIFICNVIYNVEVLKEGEKFGVMQWMVYTRVIYYRIKVLVGTNIANHNTTKKICFAFDRFLGNFVLAW